MTQEGSTTVEGSRKTEEETKLYNLQDHNDVWVDLDSKEVEVFNVDAEKFEAIKRRFPSNYDKGSVAEWVEVKLKVTFYKDKE